MKYAVLISFLCASFMHSLQANEGDSFFYEKLSFESDSTIFPLNWVRSEINAKATPIDSIYISQSQKVLETAIRKYPSEVIQKYLGKVFVVSTLEFYGLRYGGTNSASNIYLCNRGFSDEWLEMAFHAEFSSMLLRRNAKDFDKNEWVSQNDSSVIYGKSGVEALKLGQTSIKLDEELSKKGILYQYALSSLENDFNSYAENILLNRKEFWDLAKNNARVLAKANLVISFYKHIDERFDIQNPTD